MYFEETRFEPSGFVHAACCRDYFGTTLLLDRAAHFSPQLTESDLADLENALRGD